jgi:hypothetical protein
MADSTLAAMYSLLPGPVAAKRTVSAESMTSWKEASRPSLARAIVSGAVATRPMIENSDMSNMTPSAPAICALDVPTELVIWIRRSSAPALAVVLVASRLPAPGSLRTTTSAPRHSPR